MSFTEATILKSIAEKLYLDLEQLLAILSSFRYLEEFELFKLEAILRAVITEKLRSPIPLDPLSELDLGVLDAMQNHQRQYQKYRQAAYARIKESEIEIDARIALLCVRDKLQPIVIAAILIQSPHCQELRKLSNSVALAYIKELIQQSQEFVESTDSLLALTS